MAWNVYLAGEIHSDWRERIAEGAKQAGLDVTFSSPVTDHGASDDVGVAILGQESEGFWKDHKGAGVNAIRTQTLIRQADVVVVRFGDRYKQWNAAFDAGYAAALGKPIVTLHDPDTTPLTPAPPLRRHAPRQTRVEKRVALGRRWRRRRLRSRWSTCSATCS